MSKTRRHKQKVGQTPKKMKQIKNQQKEIRTNDFPVDGKKQKQRKKKK